MYYVIVITELITNLSADWEHTVKVGVLDCAEDENIPICREHDIMGYPTVKLFGAYASKVSNHRNLGLYTLKSFVMPSTGFCNEVHHLVP